MTEKQQTNKKVALLKELCHYQMELSSFFSLFVSTSDFIPWKNYLGAKKCYKSIGKKPTTKVIYFCT